MRKIATTLAGLGASAASLLLALPAYAQTNAPYLGQIQDTANLGTTDLPTLLGSIIGVVLSVLGVVLLVLVLYAGFLWMTAGGDSGQVDKAKSLIINGVIGLVLILAALAISNFVFNVLTDATGTETTEFGG